MVAVDMIPPPAPFTWINASTSCTASVKPKRKQIRLKTARRREQCRANQTRYRKRQIMQAKVFETSVEQLRQEIPLLEKKHRQLVSSSKLYPSHVVVEYFHHFRYGSLPPRDSAFTPQTWLQNSEVEQRVNFLRSSMSDDVSLGELRGVDALVEQWRGYTTYFDDIYFQLKHMTKVSAELTTATAELSVVFSESTFEHVFPRLNSEGTKAAALKLMLLGQRLNLPCHLCFKRDEASKR